MVSFEQVLADTWAEYPEEKVEWDRTQAAREFANAIIKYRIDHNLTQTALGRVLGMSQQQAARMEDGETLPTLTTVQRVAQALGLSITITIEAATGNTAMTFA